MDGWVSWWMGGWGIDGWIDGLMDERVDGWMGELVDGWMGDRWMD